MKKSLNSMFDQEKYSCNGPNSIELLKKQFYFFTYILPDYVSHESLKEFWKNSHFENMRADFLRRCQNSLRQTDDAFGDFFGVIMPSLLIQLKF